jgi:hypothetical protein
MPSRTKSRLIAAVLLAPWAAPAPFILIAFAEGGGSAFQSGLVPTVFYSALVAYLGLFLVGLPIAKALKHLGYLNVPAIAFLGVLAGVLIFYAFMLLFGVLLGSSAVFGIKQLAWGAALGFVVAVAFGVISGITMRWRATR